MKEVQTMFKDNEETIKLIDSLVWIQYPRYYKEIHVIHADSEDFRIVPKYQKVIGPNGVHSTNLGYKYAESVKEVFDILRNDNHYGIRWYTGPCDDVRDIKVKWMVLDALGLPYIKLGGDILAVNWGTKEKLIYKGNDEKQEKEYKYANIILGFEEPDEEFKKKFTYDETDTYENEISMSRRVAQDRQRIRN